MINNMRVIGLTGGTGAGKGEVSLCFMSHGIKSLDTDKVSREVCLPGKPCLNELVEYFGEGILLSDADLQNSFSAKKIPKSVRLRKTLLTVSLTVILLMLLMHGSPSVKKQEMHLRLLTRRSFSSRALIVTVIT